MFERVRDLLDPSCHGGAPACPALDSSRGRADTRRTPRDGSAEPRDLSVALVGNPNVGKSTLFNALTGGTVETANYPGTTIEVTAATITVGETRLRILDLPGAYGLSGATIADQALGRRHLLDDAPDRIVVVVDATNLARNLYLVLQALDLGLPTVVALNLMDAAAREGLHTDVPRLAHDLRVPVVATIASRGAGTRQLLEEVLARKPEVCAPRYDRRIEDAVEALQAALPPEATRADALLLLESDDETAAKFPEGASSAARETASLGDEEGMPLVVADRHRKAAGLAAGAQRARGELPPDPFWRLATHKVGGGLLLAAMLAGLVAFLFIVGNALATGLTNLWSALVSPVIGGLVHALFGTGALAKTLLWGFDSGIIAALSVGIPFVFTVYFMLAVLEDSGYLNAAAFIADRWMSSVGLHGRAVIPLFAGFGCSVPAIISTRVLANRRDRTVASMMISLIPCSARTAVIAGAVARFVGWEAAIGIFAVDLVLVAATGRALNLLLPGKSSGLVMEVFPFRRPILRHVWRKTWHRFRTFVVVATPIVVIGSLVLGALYESGWMWTLTRPMSPIVVDWLRLPPVAGLALIFALLRKELALQLLVTLAIVRYGTHASNLLEFMTAPQIVTYALVNTIFVPCIATVAVLRAELGTKRMLAISAGSIAIALLFGGIAARVLPAMM